MASRSSAMVPTLQRFDSSITSILETGGHVSMYAFTSDRGAWLRYPEGGPQDNIEGALFVVARSTAPRVMVVVLNRNNPTNFAVALDKETQVELNCPFIFVRRPGQQTFGLWFGDEESAKRMGDVVGRICASNLSALPSLSAKPKAKPKAKQAKAKAKAKATPKRTGKRGKAKRGRGNAKAAVDQDTQPLPNAKRPRWTAALAPTSAAPVRFAAQRGAVLEKLREHTLARCILDGGMMVVGGGVEEEVEGDL